MKELLQTVLSTSKERIANPIIGSFILSWLAFNWQPISVLFFSEKLIEERIRIVNLSYSPISNLLLYPLAAVIVYVLIVPHISLFF